MSSEVSPVRTVNRLCDILNCFSTDKPVLSLTTISAELGLPKSTVHRLLSALEDQGILNRTSSGRGYRLGYQLLRWGMVVQATLDLRLEAVPILQQLSRATGETAILSVRDGHRGVCLDMAESSQPVRWAMRAGQQLYLHAGASAKVLLAFLPHAEIERILSEIELPALQVNTITDRDKLRAELETIRERGYATSYEETDRGAMGVSAPVCDYWGRCVAGIGIAAPQGRIPPARVPAIAVHVLEASRQLGQRLGAK